jgi:glutamine amidotransferase
MGNLRSVQKAFEAVGSAATLSRKPEDIASADALVVPGVGSFGDCLKNLDRYGVKDAIADFLRSGRPYLGICLGLHILFDASEEAEGSTGLSVFPGRIRRFRGAVKIPHMGWNTIRLKTAKSGPCPLLEGIEDVSYVYFVHSYYPAPETSDIVAAITDYEQPFVSAVWSGSIMATQFHPEKSQRVGLRMIENFTRYIRGAS